jgi:hypothetical protein
MLSLSRVLRARPAIPLRRGLRVPSPRKFPSKTQSTNTSIPRKNFSTTSPRKESAENITKQVARRREGVLYRFGLGALGGVVGGGIVLLGIYAFYRYQKDWATRRATEAWDNVKTGATIVKGGWSHLPSWTSKGRADKETRGGTRVDDSGVSNGNKLKRKGQIDMEKSEEEQLEEAMKNRRG